MTCLRHIPDRHLLTLLKIAKTGRGLRPFFGPVQGMIALREEATLRGMDAGRVAHHEMAHVMATEKDIHRTFEKMEEGNDHP